MRAVMPVTVPLMILVGSLALARPHARESIDSSKDAQTPSDIARLQVERGTVVQVPVKGKVKISLKEDEPIFPMPGGMSSVVLLRLPEYQEPYTLSIVSLSKGIGFKREIFVPSGIYFDDGFQQVAEWAEESVARGFWHVSTSVTFRESDRTLRYLLLYTRGEWVDRRLQLQLHQSLDLLGIFPLKRTLRGNIRVETKLAKRD